MHGEMTSLQQDLVNERTHGRSRHGHLVETLTAALQARDAALGALKRLEGFCNERGVEINGLAVYESLKADMSTLNAATHAYENQRHHQQEEHEQVVETMMRGLVEVDHELAESERRYRALRSAVARGATSSTTDHRTSGNASMNQSRSTSRNSRFSSATTSHAAATPTAAAAAAANAFVAAHPVGHAANLSHVSQSQSATVQSQSVLYSSSRHISPSATRPAASVHHSPSYAASIHIGTPLASAHAATTPSRSFQRDLSEHAQHEQRLTRDFLTKTSPANSPPAGLSHSYSARETPQQAKQVSHVNPVTTAHTTVSSTHVLSTSASNATSRLRTHTSSSTVRESSYQLPLAGQTSGNASLRVNRSTAPAATATAPSAASAASGLPRRTPARGPVV